MSNKEVAQRIYRAFNQDEFDEVLTMAAEDIKINLIPFGQTFDGHEGFRQFMAGFKQGFPDGEVLLDEQVAEGDSVVNVLTFTGTHTGPLPAPTGEIPPTGESVQYPVVEVWQFRDGKVAGFNNYFDSATLMRQLGLL